MATPSDLESSISSIQWTNGRGLVTGATLLGVMTLVLGIFGTLGTWSASGVFTPSIPSGTVTSGMLAPGVQAGILGTTGVTPGSYGGPASSLSATVGADGRLTALGSQTIALSASQVSGLAPSATSPGCLLTGCIMTGPAVEPIVAFAALPTANVKGAHIFCSDCLKPGQSTGGGTGMAMFNDGTGWFSSAGTAAAGP